MVSAGLEFDRRVLLKHEHIQLEDGDCPALAEPIGRYLGIGTRKEDGNELRMRQKEVKHNPTAGEVEALAKFQDSGKGSKWAEIDGVAGQAELQGVVFQNPAANINLLLLYAS